MLSVEMALLMICNNSFLPVPYLDYTRTPRRIRRVMVNAVGFGGNAVSLLLKAPPRHT
jgi:3-oxoacyl-(acyl-carrier-protein) synthase